MLYDISVIVKASSGPRYVVGCRSKVDKEKLTSGARVVLDMTTLTIMRALPREVDPVVYNMLHEDPGNVSYSAVGGLSDQIRELRESIELPLMNPELFLRVGIKPPKPCIIFMDEIDAIGGRRFSEGTSADLELLNQLGKVKMIMADVLDPALLRPGRLDRKIEIPLPNEQSRMEILKIHAAGIAKHGELDYEAVVKLAEGFNGADLRNVCTEAGMSAIRAERDYVIHEDFMKTGQDSGNRMFILGMGFVGQFFAQELLNEGWVVSGTCTSMKKRNELHQRGFDVILFDANQPEMDTMNSLKSCTHLLVSIPPVMGIGDPMLQHGELLRSTLMDGNLQWLCYLSSTSVYGDCGGACVDEDYPASPTNEVAKLRLAAEQGWLKVAHDVGIKAHVFRLGVRVHVADISQALKASVHIQLSRRIYNIVDDDPVSRKEVFAYALDLVEKKWPSLAKEITSRERAEPFGQKASLRGEKQVSNARMKKELGVQLLYPSYKSGLQSIIDQMENPF
ncbi:hypothetical protein V6N11_052971 [Hibiscus sabdariffa]|uniref:Uncharacterized protein n=1 Tax=Hibiscus sabdariffa TaxID=183260 RepID=A0ABR2UBM9_9ROSI